MIMLIVAVATGFAVPVAQAMPAHGPMMATVAMNMDGLGTCAHDGCPLDQNVDMHGSCFVACGGVSVLPPVAAIFHYAAAQAVLAPSFDLALVDRSIRPDPHPPK